MGPGLSLAVMIFVTLLSAVYLFALSKGSKTYKDVVEAIDSPMKYAYMSGLYMLDMVHFNYGSTFSKKKIKNCQIVYGEKYAEFYFRINLAKQITSVFLTLIIGFTLAVLMETYVVLLLAAGSAFGIAYYFETTITDIIKKREDSIIATFPDVLSKLALLVNAGMIVKEAWEKVANTGEGTIYEEMRNAVSEMNNGISEFDAIMNFANRCNVDKITKFASTMVQNLSKGNKELAEFLRQFSNEAWVEKKQYARQKGEEAASKLLIPITLMFVGILLMVVVPIFMGISV
ncbi:MAG: type II secretion system F family protein [Clostridiales bacterium]|nr:type II secretion system F family protein [Clostridiales bacterium]